MGSGSYLVLDCQAGLRNEAAAGWESLLEIVPSGARDASIRRGA